MSQQNLFPQVTLRAITFYKLASYHKVGYQNEIGVATYKVGKDFDETVHVTVEQAGYNDTETHDQHTALVRVKAQTELGTMFVQLLSS